MGLIWFSRVFTDFHSILIRFYFVRPGFIGFCFDFRDLTDCLPGCTVFLTDYLWVLLGFFLVGLGFDGFFIQFSRLFTGPFIDDKESDQLGASTRSKQKQKKRNRAPDWPVPAGRQPIRGGGARCRARLTEKLTSRRRWGWNRRRRNWQCTGRRRSSRDRPGSAPASPRRRRRRGRPVPRDPHILPNAEKKIENWFQFKLDWKPWRSNLAGIENRSTKP